MVTFKCNTKILEAVEIYFSHEIVHCHWNLKRFTIMHRTQIACISEGEGGGGTPRNKFPIPELTLCGCKCGTVETQHYTNVRQIPALVGVGGGGGGDGQP